MPLFEATQAPVLRRSSGSGWLRGFQLMAFHGQGHEAFCEKTPCECTAFFSWRHFAADVLFEDFVVHLLVQTLVVIWLSCKLRVSFEILA